MLAIERPVPNDKSRPKCSPNVLPCRIRHDGPVDASKRYWNPQNEEDGSMIAYFRGRKLRGRRVLVPEGYRGAILNKIERPATMDLKVKKDDEAVEEEENDDEEEDEDQEHTRVLDEVAVFNEFTVWGHEELPDEKENALARGVTEWIRFAEALHVDKTPQSIAGVANKAPEGGQPI